LTTYFGKVRNILIAILFINFLVAMSKIFYGYYTDTLSIQADGYHSLSDGIANIVGIIGIQIASKPPDKDHPYGHKKYENLASIVVAMMLVFISLTIIHGAYERFVTGAIPTITSISFLVMLIAMTISIIISVYELKKGKELNSEFLLADSVHTRSDVYSSVAVILGLAVIYAGYPLIDPIIAIIIAILIINAAYNIIRQNSESLCDASKLDNRSIKCLAELVDGVEDCHKVRTRGFSNDVHVDLHVTVSPALRTDEAHAIANEVENILETSFQEVTDVVVHVEPEFSIKDTKKEK